MSFKVLCLCRIKYEYEYVLTKVNTSIGISQLPDQSKLTQPVQGWVFYYKHGQNI